MQDKKYKLNNNLFDKLIFITVKIDGKDILAMFDTGASISVISRSLANEFNYQNSRSLSACNNNGKKFAVETCFFDGIEICGLAIDNIEIGIITDEYLDFGVDDRGRTFPAQMLLGWDVISQFCWRIDTKNQLYGVSECFEKKENNLSYSNFPIIKLKYKTEFVLFGFDTGHTDTVLNQTWMTKLDGLLPVDDEFCGVGGTSVERSFVTNNLAVAFEGEQFCLKATVLRHNIYGLENSSAVGLLGIDFFENSLFEIDYGNRYFHIEKIRE